MVAANQQWAAGLHTATSEKHRGGGSAVSWPVTARPGIPLEASQTTHPAVAVSAVVEQLNQRSTRPPKARVVALSPVEISVQQHEADGADGLVGRWALEA